MIQAVIFDLDNTLYDYDACDRYAMEALKRHCMDTYALSGSDFTALYERAKKDVKVRLGNVAASHNRMLYAQRFLELAAYKPAGGALELYDTYWNAVLERMEPYAYVLPLFQKLADRNMRIALLSDLTAHIQHRKIRKLGISDYVDVLVTSEEAGKEKPQQVMFELVLKKLGLAAGQAVMIGDSRQKDIDGALAAGMHAILFSCGKEGTIIEECMEVINREAAEK